MALNPIVETIADGMQQAFGESMTARSVDELRTMTAGMIPVSAIEVGSVFDSTVSTPARQVPIRVYRPTATAKSTGVLMWIHGGGFVLGGLAMGDDLSRRLCEALGVAVVNLDYALAPEHPFPAGVDDCLAVYEWIRSGPAELQGFDRSRIAVAGDSAGGNLAMVLSMRCRDEARTPPVCQVSVYGTAECVVTNPELGDLIFLTAADAEWFWEAYTSDHENPYVSPARAPSVAGLPPLFVVTAEHDPTRDGSERYGNRVTESGGVARVRRYPGVHHGFFGLVDVLDEARDAFGDVVAFITEQMRTS
ncbi:alpha/beta hydrolase [Williamsia soli]|uniref:alpha/beta hydrolase n=1 Tax=Williamsia soli TaxID=364929 RepID=UPI001A9DB623|nr:alpha/beta hydrolase [Williamsia soli]